MRGRLIARLAGRRRVHHSSCVADVARVASQRAARRSQKSHRQEKHRFIARAPRESAVRVDPDLDPISTRNRGVSAALGSRSSRNEPVSMKVFLVPFETNLALARKSRKLNCTPDKPRDRPPRAASRANPVEISIRRRFPNRGEERWRVENGRLKTSSLMGNGNRVCVQAVRHVISNYHAVVKAVRRWLAAN